MKRRILGLALALCLIVGLLPMAVWAEENQSTGALNLLSVVVGANDQGDEHPDGSTTWKADLDSVQYGKTAADGKSISWDGTEGDYNIKIEQTTNGLEITLNGAKLIRTKSLLIGMTINYDGAVTINLIGENVIDYDIDVPAGSVDENNQVNALAAIYVKATKCTITGTGSLTAKADGMAGKGAGSLIDLDGDTGNESKSAEVLGSVIEADCDLTIKETTLDLDQVYSGGRTPYGNHGIRCSGNLTIDNADVNIYAQYGAAIKLSTSRKDATLVANKDLTITNGSKVTVEANEPALKVGTGSLVFDTANATEITIKNTYRPFNKTPVINGEYEAYYSNSKDGTDLKAYTDDPAGGVATSSTTHPNYLYFQFKHACNASADDHDCTTVENCAVCNQPIGTAQTAHTPEADDGDCTTAVMCANPGCEKVATAAAAAHTPEADDGDCTTAIKCSVCGTETTPAASAHTPPANRTDCSVAANCTVCGKEALAAGQHTGGTATCKDKAVCTVCNQAYGELAAHTGGTATCKDKAVCTVCNQAYGELSTTHTPAADDGNCSTAVKCTVCQAEVVAAKTHKFANSTDTSCDNAGCTHTRTVSTNPNTGDVSILLTAAIALSSAVGFAGVTVLRKKDN